MYKRQVYELRPVIGNEDAEFTINGTDYRKAENGSVITVKANGFDTKYNVSYGDKVESGNEITQTITNTKITADLKLLKVDTNNHRTILPGAVFALYKNNGDDQPGGVVKENITTGANGQATVTGLVPGKYILRETKAPTGYTPVSYTHLAHRAADIYPFDDWQIWEIDSLIGMARYKEGMEVYKRTAKLLFDEMGISPSEKMLERFKLMGERTSQAAGAIEDIKYRLKEKEAVQGAYFCAFPSFVDVYHVFSRMMERTGISVFLMLCTLDFEDQIPTSEEERSMSDTLRKTIQNSARKGDFYTRYNVRQYLIMLIGINQENCQLVSKRIDRGFKKRIGYRKNVQIDYYVASVGEVCDENKEREIKNFVDNRVAWSETTE